MELKDVAAPACPAALIEALRHRPQERRASEADGHLVKSLVEQVCDLFIHYLVSLFK